jgi:hypothetical protein
VLRLTPSEVVDLIERACPWTGIAGNVQRTSGGDIPTTVVGGIAAAIESIAPELVILTGDDLSYYVAAVGALRVLCTGEAHTNVRTRAGPQYGGVNEIAAIHDGLKNCPNEIPNPETTRLTFLQDKDLRDQLRRDLSTCESALVNREWKACTVVAGSVAEALLLWSIQQRTEPDQQLALVAAQTAGKANGCKVAQITRWSLGDFAAVAYELHEIEQTTAIQADVLRLFRDLIHPGREQRLKQRCDRSTTLSAMGCVEAIAVDLAKRH